MNAKPPVLLELVAVVASIAPDDVELVPSDELLLAEFEPLELLLEVEELELLLDDDDVCEDDPLVGPLDVVVLVLVGHGVVVLVYVGPVGVVDVIVEVTVTGDVYVLVPPPLPEPPEPPELPADAGPAKPISSAAKMHNPPTTPAARIKTVLTGM